MSFQKKSPAEHPQEEERKEEFIHLNPGPHPQYLKGV